MPASKVRFTESAEMPAWERAREMFMSGLGVLSEKYNHSLSPSTAQKSPELVIKARMEARTRGQRVNVLQPEPPPYLRTEHDREKELLAKVRGSQPR